MLRFQRRLVNEVVWSFCWQCRNPQRKYDAQWWFATTTWAEHMAQLEHSNYGSTDYKNYLPFLDYLRHTYRGQYTYSVSLLRSLELYTSAWRAEHFEYAKELINRYYKEPCDGTIP